MTLKAQTSRRGLVVTAAFAVAVVAAGVTATAMMNSDDAPGGTAVEQGAPQGGGQPAAPVFLSAADLPTGDAIGQWTDQGTTAGLPEQQYVCISGALPVAGTTYKSFASDMTGEFREFVTTATDAAGAELLAKEVAQSIERCAETMKAKDDGKDTTWKKNGTYAEPANGLSVYSVFFAPPESEYHLQMYGVGRDGSNVVVTSLSMQGRESEAPVTAFTATAKTALDKAF